MFSQSHVQEPKRHQKVTKRVPQQLQKIVKTCVQKWNPNWNPKITEKIENMSEVDELGRVGGMGWARVNLPLAGGGLSGV